MCSPAPIVERFILDVEAAFGIPATYNTPGPGGVFLGSVGDQAHSVRRSSHNCAEAPGGQESPVNGVAYARQYAHAADYRPSTKAIGEALAAATLKDPRVRYVIYDNKGRYPDGRTWATDHPTWHVSFLPGTHDDTRPFFDQQSDDLTEAEVQAIVDAIKTQTDTLVGVWQRQGRLTRGVIQKQHAADRKQAAKLAGNPVAEKSAAKDEALADAEIKAAEDF